MKLVRAVDLEQLFEASAPIYPHLTCQGVGHEKYTACCVPCYLCRFLHQ